MIGVIIPADPGKPVLRFEFHGDADLIPALTDVIGDNIDLSGQIHHPNGRLQMAVRGDSLTRPGADVPNERALALCHTAGYPIEKIVGDAAFWGGANQAGLAQGVSGAWLAILATQPVG